MSRWLPANANCHTSKGSGAITVASIMPASMSGQQFILTIVSGKYNSQIKYLDFRLFYFNWLFPDNWKCFHLFVEGQSTNGLSDYFP